MISSRGHWISDLACLPYLGRWLLDNKPRKAAWVRFCEGANLKLKMDSSEASSSPVFSASGRIKGRKLMVQETLKKEKARYEPVYSGVIHNLIYSLVGSYVYRRTEMELRMRARIPNRLVLRREGILVKLNKLLGRKEEVEVRDRSLDWRYLVDCEDETLAQALLNEEVKRLIIRLRGWRIECSGRTVRATRRSTEASSRKLQLAAGILTGLADRVEKLRQVEGEMKRKEREERGKVP